MCNHNKLWQQTQPFNSIVGIKSNPTMLFIQSRAISRRNPVEVKEGIKYNSIESTIALSISFFINMFVICVFGAVSTYMLQIMYELVIQGHIQGGAQGARVPPLSLSPPVHHSLKLRHSAKPNTKYIVPWFVTPFKLTGLFIALKTTYGSKSFALAHSMSQRSYQISGCGCKNFARTLYAYLFIYL